MRSLVRLVGVVGTGFVGVSTISVAQAIQSAGFAWSGGAFTLRNSQDYVLLLASFWAGGIIILTFSLLGLIGTLRSLGRPTGGRALTIITMAGFLVGVSLVAFTAWNQGDPGAEAYVTVLIALSAVTLLALLGSVVVPGRRATADIEPREGGLLR